ncbi:cytochrome P450 4c21-like [Ruditapes philippinarum]|uniref:cytochrome P450 4c21-like n=1 Tax=Ruditapes philippinarum TaxID=129788 RepID=UPI00295A8539|nr:cytochrome P450 4c21-like [Ruditapes philippinarum]XP_060572603.1 cytochrome P450 4c21-like [Ruditapes philippinarum]XP_060572604.1 cytochrome P450 4c21-like [Ruditapes philippinarum]
MEAFIEWYQHLARIVTWRDFLVVILVAMVTRWLYRTFIQPFLSPLRKLPGRPYRPFVGNMFEALKGEAMTTAIRWLRMHHCLTIRYYHFGGRERVLTADPKVFRHIMVTHEKNYKRVPPQSPILKIMGQALFFLSGDIHHSVRKLLNPAFSLKMLENMIPVFETKSKKVVTLWKEKFDQASSDTDWIEFPVQDYMTRIALDSICFTGLDFDLDAIGQPDSSGVQILNKYLRQVGGASLLASLIPFYNSLPLRVNKERWREEAYIKSLINSRISDKRQQYKDCDESAVNEARDFLSLLVLARDEEGRSIPDDLVFENVAGLLFAGFDTTSITLTWTMLHLASYPEVQEHARKEVQGVIPNNCDNITHDMLDQLQYLHCVIKETQRLYPVVSNTTREALSDDVINGLHIPAGTKVVLHLGALHRMEENWENPEKFLPERFMEDTEPYKHLPFIAGPHMCIGHKFAMLEMKMVLSSLLREFEFSLVPNYKFKRIQALSVKPKPPLVLNVRRIQN